MAHPAINKCGQVRSARRGHKLMWPNGLSISLSLSRSASLREKVGWNYPKRTASAPPNFIVVVVADDDDDGDNMHPTYQPPTYFLHIHKHTATPQQLPHLVPSTPTTRYRSKAPIHNLQKVCATHANQEPETRTRRLAMPDAIRARERKRGREVSAATRTHSVCRWAADDGLDCLFVRWVFGSLGSETVAECGTTFL